MKFKIEKEIFSQYEALKKTYNYLISQSDKILEFYSIPSFNNITFIGCGSSYSLCKSACITFKMSLGIPANSIAAGDLMLNFPHYQKIIEKTLIITLSRSGSTSEVLLAIDKAKKKFNTPCISICAKSDSKLSKISDLSLELPWAFDESICQTRTVSNLYLANLLLLGIIADDHELINEIKVWIEKGESFMKKYKDDLREIGEMNERIKGKEVEGWNNAIILADSELEGIADEAAIVLKEVSQVPTNYSHILDVRHGHIVVLGKKTLVIMACSPFGKNYQKALISELKRKGAIVITVSNQINNPWGSDYNIIIDKFNRYCVFGIPFIFVAQVIALYKALLRDLNPDEPPGLESWISL